MSEYRLLSASISNGRKPVATAKGPRYQVRWYLEDSAGREHGKKLTTFIRIGEANAFLEQVERAKYGADGWRFDAEGMPTNLPEPTTTVVEAVLEYSESKWHTDWSENTRMKKLGRLADFIALTLRSVKDQDALRQAFSVQAHNRGKRPLPCSDVDWAGRWLRDEAFHSAGSSAPCHGAQDGGRAWVFARSMPLDALDGPTLTRARTAFTAGYEPATARTYWEGIIVPFLTWLYETDRVSRDLTLGHKTIARDTEYERVDPNRVANPIEVAALAKKMGEAHGEQWELYVLLSAYCALRAGEALAIRYNDFYYRPDGRLCLRVASQLQKVVKAASDTGSTKVRKGTKSPRGYTKPPRYIPLPGRLASLINQGAGERLTSSSDLLFTGPRGAVGNYDTVRGWWVKVVSDGFSETHHLAGLGLHGLRHAGMSWWFAAGYDHAIIQQWGGWSSLKVMLDTYRGVIDDPRTISLAGLDKFEKDWTPEPVQLPEGVIDLSKWKSSRA